MTISLTEEYNKLMNNVCIFDITKWQNKRNPYFGDKGIRELASTFNICANISGIL
jgi:hypothetical protein